MKVIYKSSIIEDFGKQFVFSSDIGAIIPLDWILHQVKKQGIHPKLFITVFCLLWQQGCKYIMFYPHVPDDGKFVLQWLVGIDYTRRQALRLFFNHLSTFSTMLSVCIIQRSTFERGGSGGVKLKNNNHTRAISWEPNCVHIILFRPDNSRKGAQTRVKIVMKASRNPYSSVQQSVQE